TEAEAVADLIAADTAQQRRQAMTQLEGALGALYEDWRGRLMRALARLEAEIDFPDEGLPPDLLAGIRDEIATLRAEITAHLDDRRRGERTRDGVSVAILGPPNSGKSSLLNWLARRDVAITSEIAGTTRDIIEVHLDLGGFPLLVADTAGLRETADAIEREGVKRALARAEAADIRIILLDATRPDIAVDARLVDDDALVIVNKVDLVPPARGSRARFQHAFGVRIDGSLSIKTGEGMTALLNRLTAEAALRVGEVGAPPLTRARHREALEHCVAALGRFEAAPLPELAAEDLRQAARSLGRITGRVDVEDMLDILFRDFCIGK
ncbi:MAG: tRNA uridine-5-carboxymethylaminomethyl(34) synthesis GTPase MnmE, partial [Stellaceae bacterium]